MRLQEGTGSKPDEIYGEVRIRVRLYKLPEEKLVICFEIIQCTKPLRFMGFPQIQPFTELFF